jgi:hypothetical protein
MKYLSLIDTIAFLHQYQRPIKQDPVLGKYVEVTLEDIALANELASEVLGQSLRELPPQTKYVLDKVYELVSGICESEEVEQNTVWLTRRMIREKLGVSDTALRKHIYRLLDLEYMVAHRGSQGQNYSYELLYQGEGKEGESFCMGLIDVNELKNSKYDEHFAPLNGNLAPPMHPQNTPDARGVHPEQNEDKSMFTVVSKPVYTKEGEKAFIGEFYQLWHRIVVVPMLGVKLSGVFMNWLEGQLRVSGLLNAGGVS